MIRKTTRLLIETIVVVVAALAAFIGVSAWRLSAGPVSLQFVTPYVIGALTPADQSVKVTVADTVLTWVGDRRAVELHAIGVRALGKTGRLIATIPELSIRFSAKALLRGLVAPTKLTVIGPRIQLIRAEDGSISVDVATAPGPAGEKQPRPAAAAGGGAALFLISDLLKPPNPDRPLGYLQQISIRGAEVVVDDRFLGISWRAPSAGIVLARSIVGLRARAAFSAEIDGHKAAVNLVGLYSNRDDRFQLAAGFRNLDPSVLAGGSRALAPLLPLKMSIDGNIRMSMNRAGVIGDVAVTLRSGSGRIDLPDALSPDLEVEALSGNAVLTHGLSRVRLRDVRMRLRGGIDLSLSGDVRDLAGAARARVTVAAQGLKFADLKRYWPRTVATGARAWITENITGGRVPEVRAGLTLRKTVTGKDSGDGEIAVTGLRGALLFDGLTVSYLAPLPPVENIHGAGTFDLKGVYLRIARGRVEGLKLAKSRVRILGFDRETQVADIRVALDGGLSKVLTILDHPRLGFASAMGFDPAAIDGKANIDLRFRVPLLANLTFGQVGMDVRAKVHDIVWRKGILDRDFENGQLTLKINKKRMDIEGASRFANIPLKVAWTEYFGKKVKLRRRVSAVGRAKASRLSEFGYDISRFAKGMLPVRLDYTASGKGTSRFAFKVGLREATLDVPELNWRKRPGAPGQADFTIVARNGAVVGIRDAKIKAAGLVADGDFRFAPDSGRLTAAKLRRLAVGLTDVGGTLRTADDGTYVVDLVGNGLDISGLLEPGTSGDWTLPAMTTSARIARLYTRPDRYLAGARLRTVFDGEDWRFIRFRGALIHRTNKKGAGVLTVDLVPKGTRRRDLKIFSSDAGGVAWTFGVSDNVVGGQLKIEGSIDDEKPKQPLSAVVGISDYQVVGAPVMAQVLTLASLTGIANLLSGEGISFRRLELPLVKSGDLVRVKNARAVGSELGLTLNGTVDLAASNADLHGTIVPAYTINSLLGNIPILGEIFVGEKGSGVFAARYAIKGSLDDPKVTVDPLAALTPGFLRNIFGILDSGPAERKVLKPRKKQDGKPAPKAVEPSNTR